MVHLRHGVQDQLLPDLLSFITNFFPFSSYPFPHCLDSFCLSRINVLGSNLFPSVEYPVPVGTPLISPYIKWDHSQDWDVPKAEDFPAGSKGSASGSAYNIGVLLAWGLLLVCHFPALLVYFLL